MAIAFRAAGAKATDGTSPFSVTPALPAGMSANDIVILVVATESTGTASLTADGSVTPWTAITGSPVDVTGGKKLYVWWGRWASGTTGPTITATTNMIIAATAAWSGCDTGSSVINNQETGSESTSDTSLSFTTTISTTVNNCMVLLISNDDTDSNTAQHGSQANSNLGSIAERVDVNTNAGTPGGGFQITEGTLATAGAIGTWTTTLATSSAKAYLVLALAPLTSQTFPQTLSASQLADASLTRISTFSRTFSSTTPILPTLTTISTYFRTLSATQLVSTSLVTALVFLKTLSQSSNAIATLTAVQLKIAVLDAIASATATIGLALTFIRTLSSEATILATFSIVKTVVFALSATVVALGDMTRKIGQLIIGKKILSNLSRGIIMSKINDSAYIEL